MTEVLRASNVETMYGRVMAIRGISLTVKEGSVVTVMGSNGAGKTTILKTISGALDPFKGQVEFEGRDITGLDPDVIARAGIAHSPEGREVFSLLSVKDNLMMGAYCRKDRDAVARDVEKVLDWFPVLRTFLEKQAIYLSGGQQQMLALGRAFMQRPHLMLLDEPSLGLSPLLISEIFQIIKRINVEEGMTMLLVEQNASVALPAADFGYVLETGRIVMEGERDVLMNSADIREFYLGIKAESARGDRRWKARKTWR
ncbi:ABC transporter ATP-binding protein [Paracoccus albus]|uniref:ABC transporter ATP-binding protein n=1 Tax=Paracoccus albus TaxID=3017784 RepID=UPI0022F10409|nr:ABC transporter ATP-binding protein [Paracoccus albus]WBU62312.1 ABC transporter ATP-binding protein [Paracoccus albus]GLT12755.1 ABC transporter ATP-binding protein [Sulfitobacter porphyrae]